MRLIEGLQPLRFRQAEQCERPIGLELDDALDHRAGALLAKAAVEHEDAHKARRVSLEVGGKQRLAIGIFRHREAGAIKQFFDREFFLLFRQQVQIERHQQRARLRQAHHGRRQRSGIGDERDNAGRRQLPGVGGKFRMLFPAQHGAAEDDTVLFGGRFQRLKLAAGAEIAERHTIALGGVAGGIEGKVQDAPRRRDRRKRARMDFAEDRRAQGMRGELSAVLDGDVRGHAHRVACTGNFGKMGPR